MGVQEPIRGYRDFAVRGHEGPGQEEKRRKFYVPSVQADDTSSRLCVASYLQVQLQDNLFSAQRGHRMEGTVAHWKGGFLADDRGSACECGLSV